MVEHVVNRGGLKRTVGRPHSQEQMPMTAFGPRLANVVNHQVGGFIAERQSDRLLGFGLGHPQRTTAPVEVIEGQTYQLPTAQAVSRGQIQQREVAESKRLGTIDGTKQCLDLGPSKRSRQPLQAVHPRGIYLQMQGSRKLPLSVLPPQVRPNSRHDMLQAEAVVSSG